MDSNIRKALARLTSMQTEAVAGEFPSATAVPFGLWSQERNENWTNQVVSFTVDRTSLSQEEIEIREYTVNMRFIYGHFDESQAYEGEMQKKALDTIEAVLDYFALNPYLTSTANPTELSFVASSITGAYITGGTGLRVLESGQGRKFASDFTLIIPIYYNILD